jgi:hypothetical protein
VALSAENVNTTIPIPGETGLQAERVTFLARTDYLQWFTEASSVAAAKPAAIVRAHFGKEPKVLARQSIREVLRPSGTFHSLSRNGSGFPTLVFPGAATLRNQGVLRARPGT